jgi:hypothetical protein
MRNWKYIFIFFILSSCNEKLEEVVYSKSNCQGVPAFIKKVVPNTQGLAFSTSVKQKLGLWFIEPDENGNAKKLIYQDSTWKMGGWLGPMLTDKNGNIWCAPAPLVNVLDNPTEKQNNLYRVNPNTGKMELFLTLPNASKTSVENPYGIMGVTYNCEANVLYVSTVAGSTRKQQQGKIYCIDIENKKIQSTLDCGDAFGVGISLKDGFRKLYFGSARNSNIYSIGLNEKGSFLGKPAFAFTLDGQGPRGDDKAKKIREDAKGNLIITGYEFNFNLTAPFEKQENKYIFTYNFNVEKWVALLP